MKPYKKIVNERGLAKAKWFLNFPQYWQQSESGRQQNLNHSCCDKVGMGTATS